MLDVVGTEAELAEALDARPALRLPSSGWWTRPARWGPSDRRPPARDPGAGARRGRRAPLPTPSPKPKSGPRRRVTRPGWKLRAAYETAEAAADEARRRQREAEAGTDFADVSGCTATYTVEGRRGEGQEACRMHGARRSAEGQPERAEARPALGRGDGVAARRCASCWPRPASWSRRLAERQPGRSSRRPCRRRARSGGHRPRPGPTLTRAGMRLPGRCRLAPRLPDPFRHGRCATVTVPEAIPLELWRRRRAGWLTPPRGTRERGPRPPAGRCREDHRVPVPRRPALEAPRPPTAAAAGRQRPTSRVPDARPR